MNIAILVGVSEYNNIDDLPACEKDLEKMVELIKATGKYDNIVCISENTDAATVKEKITNEISNLEGKKIEEIFFYYTGHGDFYKDEFYYVLSDFDKEKRKQTSLENLEVDNWFRSLNPKITIKVVDACHAGIVYVKDDGNLEKYLKQSTQGRFNKCYFMFSSNVDQSSYQNDKLSFFTKSFLNAVKDHNASDIRYKDIIDYISDDFEKITTDQTPFFITQADHTEKFCSMNSSVKNLFSSPNKGELKSEAELKSQIETTTKTLESVIKTDAESYLNKYELNSLIEDIKTKIESHKYSDEFISFYDIEYDFCQGLNLPKEYAIGKWLYKNDNEYFVEIETVKESYETQVPEINLGFQTGKYKTKRKYRDVIDGFYSTVDIPYDCIEIVAKPKYPNIPCYKCIMPFVLSKSEIRFFYCFVPYKDINWDEKEMIEEEIKWRTKAFKFKNRESILSEISNIPDKYAEFIIENLKAKFEMRKEINGT